MKEFLSKLPIIGNFVHVDMDWHNPKYVLNVIKEKDLKRIRKKVLKEIKKEDIINPKTLFYVHKFVDSSFNKKALNIEGRFIEIEAHDETYYGIPETLKYLEKTGLANEIKIYSRGVDPMYPVQEYSSLENKEISSAYILEQIRARDEEKFLSETAEQDLQYLESLSQELSPKEKAESQKIINIVRQQINIRKNKNTDARD